jgi:hypothetical protein
MEVRHTAVVRIIELIKPCGVRQKFYLSEIKYVVEETEAGYEKVQRAIEEALLETARTYRRALWCDADVYVEFWVEKDVLADTIYDVTAEYNVPLMVARDYSRLTFLHSAAETIKANGKPTHVNHLDEDPSGQGSVANIERRQRQHALGIPTHFERLAVTEGLIVEWNLPTRPATKTDRRAKHWAGDSIELDAIPPDTLRRIVRNAILLYIAPEARHRDGGAVRARDPDDLDRRARGGRTPPHWERRCRSGAMRVSQNLPYRGTHERGPERPMSTGEALGRVS